MKVMSEETQTDKVVLHEIAKRIAEKFGCKFKVALLALYRKVELVTKTKVYSLENLLLAEKEMSKRNINAAADKLSEYELFQMLGMLSKPCSKRDL